MKPLMIAVESGAVVKTVFRERDKIGDGVRRDFRPEFGHHLTGGRFNHGDFFHRGRFLSQEPPLVLERRLRLSRRAPPALFPAPQELPQALPALLLLRWFFLPAPARRGRIPRRRKRKQWRQAQ
jgi:hypothetical protein